MKESIININLKKEKNLYENSEMKDIFNEDVYLNSYEEYFYDELSTKKPKGIPIASYFVDKYNQKFSMNQFENLSKQKQQNLRLKYAYLSKNHTLCCGTTGSGKTTGVLIPWLNALITQENNHSFVITDPKGEIYNNVNALLRKKNYQFFVLNFTNPSRSNKFNILTRILEENNKKSKFDVEVEIISGKPNDNYILMDDDYNDFAFYSFDNMAFSSQKTFENYKMLEIEKIDANVDALIRNLSTQIIPLSGDDVTWAKGCQSALEGFILLLIDFYNNGEIDKNQFNLKSVFDIYLFVKNWRTKSDNDNLDSIKNCPIIKSEKIAEKLSAVFDCTSSKTLTSYLSVFDSHINEYSNGKIYSMTIGQTYEIDFNEPFAIFIITREGETIDQNITAMFIDYLYQKLYEIRENKKATEMFSVDFLLDEFGNVPVINEFQNKISTARSRNVWFHLFVQSYAQLLRYGKQNSEIIIDNCNTHIFLNTANYDTKYEFQNQAGRKSISYTDCFGNKKLQETYVLKISDLDAMKEGDIYIKRFEGLIKSHFIRSYVLLENNYFNYYDENALEKNAPYNRASYFNSKFQIKNLLESYKNIRRGRSPWL